MRQVKNNMEITKYNILTPTTILETTLDIPKDYQQECINEIYNLGDSQGQTTNVKAIMTSWRIWEETTILNQLLDNILKIIDVHMTKKMPIDTENAFITKLDNAWGAIYKKGHYTQPHNHLFGWDYSFVYYLQTTGNTPLIFDECNFNINPKDDTLIVFDSSLKHSVPIHNDDIDRVCIAGNVKVE